MFLSFGKKVSPKLKSRVTIYEILCPFEVSVCSITALKVYLSATAVHRQPGQMEPTSAIVVFEEVGADKSGRDHLGHQDRGWRHNAQHDSVQVGATAACIQVDNWK